MRISFPWECDGRGVLEGARPCLVLPLRTSQLRGGDMASWGLAEMKPPDGRVGGRRGPRTRTSISARSPPGIWKARQPRSASRSSASIILGRRVFEGFHLTPAEREVPTEWRTKGRGVQARRLRTRGPPGLALAPSRGCERGGRPDWKGACGRLARATAPASPAGRRNPGFELQLPCCIHGGRQSFDTLEAVTPPI